ncbi:MAG: hypothetical protein GY750_05065 [Lentisphaerae bacterium]|nr:hypothetical protein [Lentisphaerota bacterium]
MFDMAIDPGKNGGIAIIGGDYAKAFKCPDSSPEMADIVREYVVRYGSAQCRCVIEKVHLMPGNGVKSMFSFGRNYGQWLGILSALHIPFKEIPPGVWMRKISGVPKDKPTRKRYFKTYSQQMFPLCRVTLATADALALLSVFDRCWK